MSSRGQKKRLILGRECIEDWEFATIEDHCAHQCVYCAIYGHIWGTVINYCEHRAHQCVYCAIYEHIWSTVMDENEDRAPIRDVLDFRIK